MMNTTPSQRIDVDSAIAAAELAASPEPLDQYENALVQYLKRSCGNGNGKLADLMVIWGWRNEIRPELIHLSHLAECMNDLAERCDLLGHSMVHPGAFGAMGVICDAAPDREWALSLDRHEPWWSITDIDMQTWRYWSRIVAVLASRLRMAEVSKLPGYDHDATAGPFGLDPVTLDAESEKDGSADRRAGT